jgi:hypothetical protein
MEAASAIKPKVGIRLTSMFSFSIKTKLLLFQLSAINLTYLSECGWYGVRRYTFSVDNHKKVLPMKMANTLHFYARLVLLVLFLLMQPVALANPFTAVQLQSLDKSHRVRLPLSEAYTFIAVGFHPDTQPQLEQALLTLKPLCLKKDSRLQVMEIAVIEQSRFPDNAVVRNFMRLQVRNKQLTPHIYPYFTNLRGVQSRLGVSQQQRSVFILLDNKGRIQWQKNSPPSTQDLDVIKGLVS